MSAIRCMLLLGNDSFDVCYHDIGTLRLLLLHASRETFEKDTEREGEIFFLWLHKFTEFTVLLFIKIHPTTTTTP